MDIRLKIWIFQRSFSRPFASFKMKHAGIRVPDFDAAVAWYSEKLGFHLRQSFPIGDKIFAFISPAAPWQEGLMIWDSIQDILRILQAKN